MKESRTELFVGFFLLIGLVILGSLVLKFGNFDESFDNTYPLVVTFDDGGGLLKGTDVRLGGVKIGRVADAPKVNLENYGGAIVSLDIFNDFEIFNATSSPGINLFFSIPSLGVIIFSIIFSCPGDKEKLQKRLLEKSVSAFIFWLM